VLEKPSETITHSTTDLQELLKICSIDLRRHGVGLAAPQIGIGEAAWRVDVTFKDDPEETRAGQSRDHQEGSTRGTRVALSIPDFREDVSRAKIVIVRAGPAGKFFEHTGEDLLARAFLPRNRPPERKL